MERLALQHSATKAEGWPPAGVQCQVHCTPLIETSARAVADSLHGFVEEGVSEVGARKMV